MDKNRKKEIVKMLLNQNINTEDEDELIDLLVDKSIAMDVDKADKDNEKFGDKVADKLTEIAGSWSFIIGFSLFLVIWVLLNVYVFVNLDPYPFVFLNLLLSCIAALQAPVIMMSQNRSAKKDSMRSKNDYKTDLKSELILEDLHDKMDTILKNQKKILSKLEDDKNEWYRNKIRAFFAFDARIKKQLLDLAPKEEYSYNEESLIKYYDLLYDGIKDIEVEVTSILKDLNLEYALDKADTIFNVLKENITIGNISINRLEHLYKICFSNMRSETVDYIKANSVGYSNMSLVNLLDKCTSLNEILHAIHSYILNNENLLESVPKVASKMTKYDYPITLYGTKTQMSEIIFNMFPTDSNVGYTDIVSFDKSNKILMLIRDLGHALSIEIDVNRSDITVRYHIPKLCNIHMINKLKGINKIREDADIFSGANGMFVTTKEEFVNDLFNFINMVPTDSDMEINRII